MKIPVIAAFLSICLNACAGTPVSERAPRDYDGFSIMPPQEPGWVVLAANDRQVRFQKKSGSSTHVMYVGVGRRIAPKAFDSKEQFLRYVNDDYFNVDPYFQEMLAKEVNLNPKHGEYCIEYRYKYKDYKARRPKSVPFLLHEGHCYLCLHPDAKDREYNVCYSEIFAPGEEDLHYRAAGDTFIDSIRFTEPAGAKPGARKDLFSISAELLDNKNRIFYLSTYSNPLYRLKVELDGEVVSKLSSEEVATVRCTPGRHTIKAHFGLFAREESFDMVQDGAKYFVIRAHKTKFFSWKAIDILEVPEADWKYIAVEPFYRGDNYRVR